jgi:hypothetical protein
MVGGLDGLAFEDRNSLLLAFTDPTWQERIVDWEVAARRLVAQFRAAMAGHVAESSWKCLVKRLREESPEFVAMWDQHEVRAPENLTKHYFNREVGLLHLDFTHLWFGPHSERRLTTYTPTDDESRLKLEELHDLVLAEEANAEEANAEASAAAMAEASAAESKPGFLVASA